MTIKQGFNSGQGRAWTFLFFSMHIKVNISPGLHTIWYCNCKHFLLTARKSFVRFQPPAASLHGVCMVSLCLRGFLLGTAVRPGCTPPFAQSFGIVSCNPDCEISCGKKKKNNKWTASFAVFSRTSTGADSSNHCTTVLQCVNYSQT